MSNTSIQQILAVRFCKEAACPVCRNVELFSVLVTWRTPNSQKPLIAGACCFNKMTSVNKQVHHHQYYIAARKKSESKKLTHWDKRIIGTYESWIDGRSREDFVLEVAEDIKKQKDAWKRSKGY